MSERFELAAERINEIPMVTKTPEPFRDFFRTTADFLKLALLGRDGPSNEDLYADILPAHYDRSYGNPAYAIRVLGSDYGPLFSAVYAELRGIIPCVFEDEEEETTELLELFLELHSAFEEEELPTPEEVRAVFVSWCSDYLDAFVTKRIDETVNPGEHSFASDIILHADLTDLSYLEEFGEYVSEDTVRLAAFVNSLPQETIDLMAKTYTEGYRLGFISGRKDITKKKVVSIRFELGFERMVRAAVKNFEEMGLQCCFVRAAFHLVDKRQNLRIGYYGAVPNRQFDYDHRNDIGLLLDRDYVSKKLRVLRNAYEKRKDRAEKFGGPACIETFGQEPFIPAVHEGCISLTAEQQKLYVNLNSEAGQITNRYIKGEERSFTIISFPVPEIGRDFREIFRETIAINTLDYKKYEQIQDTIIRALDSGDKVHIKGRGKNRTDLTVALHPVTDPEKQTKFENCVADVNIPVGEVFTTPQLKGTDGILHVTGVFLEGLYFKDLSLTLRDGMITDYSCANFRSEKESRAYIEENILYHHPTLPIGEFAIGTNTTAYRMAKKFGIEARMPILIAEKTGPHFAMGDTCYSWQEDTDVFNPDGREIIARDNEVSLNRKNEISKAYFGCHTDITIPYEELGYIRAVSEKGEEITIIEDGRFILPGTEELNEPLDGGKQQ